MFDNRLQADESTASRCETVLNTTMAEMDVYHEQKIEDVKMLVGDYLDGEIALYEQVCGLFFFETKAISLFLVYNYNLPN
jgi:WASP-binding domain of Sorting nexin protein